MAEQKHSWYNTSSLETVRSCSIAAAAHLQGDLLRCRERLQEVADVEEREVLARRVVRPGRGLEMAPPVFRAHAELADVWGRDSSTLHFSSSCSGEQEPEVKLQSSHNLISGLATAMMSQVV